MTILSPQTIRRLNIVTPLEERKTDPLTNTTYGLGVGGVDVRLDQDIEIMPGGFRLASTMEHFHMPNNVMAFCHDKSTWARKGLAVQNTVLESGWDGYLTLEITNHGTKFHRLLKGTPIAQIIFHYMDEPSESPYNGKYMNAGRGPQEAL